MKHRKGQPRLFRGLPELSGPQILAWADAWHQRWGTWPRVASGRIPGTLGETWKKVDSALYSAGRGLPYRSSLARLLAEHRGVRNPRRLPPLTIDQILRWADNHYRRTGTWPSDRLGAIAGTPGETWTAVGLALRVGRRELPGGSSLAMLLAQHRGVRNKRALPRFKQGQVLAWADAYHRRTGNWPTRNSGPVVEAPGETWNAVDTALRDGLRGFQGGCSLARLLAQHRQVRNPDNLPPLSVAKILAWADSFHRRTGAWPHHKSGAIAEAPGETWTAVDSALRAGMRGLRGTSSLARLLAQHRGVRNRKALPRLTETKVLAWADAYHRRTGAWPTRKSGPIAEAPGETWSAVDAALQAGTRGFRCGSSLARLLARRRGKRNLQALRRLTLAEILSWADAHHRRTGAWPTCKSGPIAEAPGETWLAIDATLRHRRRGLPGGLSLPRLLARERGLHNPKGLPPLTEKQILAWADAHYRRSGAWPTRRSGPVQDAPGETWMRVDRILYKGGRGLTGGSSVLRLLRRYRRMAVPAAAGDRG
jgi:hypothetical protein